MKLKLLIAALLALAFSAPSFAQEPVVPGSQVPNNFGGNSFVPYSSSNPLPVTGSSGSPVVVTSFAANPKASITRAGNTTTYTPNTGWNNGTPTFFSFTNACRVNGGSVLIPEIDIWSSANPTTKLTGNLWLFSGVPGTNVSDDANFNIAAADFANLTGGTFNGISFSLASSQGSGAANSGTSLNGTTYQATCPTGTTTLTGMVEVTNAYVPANAEVLTIQLQTIGNN